MIADLHLHTSASDGTRDAREVVRRAASAGCTLIAVTDHDTVSGVAAAMAEGDALGVRVVPGIELSCGDGEEIHMLGYGFDPGDAGFAAFLAGQLDGRRERMRAMLKALRALGIDIDPAEAQSADARFMGRMNLARAMVARGIAKTISEAFDKYLNPGRPGYVPRKRLMVSEGIAALRAHGALAVLAHPGRLRMDEATLSALLPTWREAGLSGVEAYHASHDPATALRYDRMARRMGLIVTGGSDSHGRQEGAQIGDHAPMWRTMREDGAEFLRRLR